MKPVVKVMLLSTTLATMAFTPKPDPKPKGAKYIDKANMDLSIKPGDNFYLYVNGNWLKKNAIPGTKTRWGSFDVLREESSKRMQTLLTDAASKASTDAHVQKVGDFYTSGMDSVAIEKLGYTPIQADLQRIDAIQDINSLLSEMVRERTQGLSAPLFGFYLGPDRKNVTQYIPQLAQGGTSLPDRDYYIKNNTRSTTIRTAYAQHLKNMFVLIGEDATTAQSHADAVLRIETALAKAQNSRTEMRDPYKTYNKFAVSDLSNLTQSMDWSRLLNELQLKGVDSVVINNPGFFKSADLLLSALPLEDWKTYVKWNVLDNTAPYLSSAFVKEAFNFTKVLTGQKEPTPRWQIISSLIDQQLGELLGQLYVEKYFKPEAKQRMLDLVNNLQQTFAARIKNLDWMSAETKTRALEKLAAFTKKIAYPDTWKDYSGVIISKDDFLGNVRRAGQWAYTD